MNTAFIDGQNLRLGTTQNNWKVDIYKLRIYLKDKYNVTKAYYFLGYLKEELYDLYEDLQSAGFIVIFREHNQKMSGKKKGNVDTDIVFHMMKDYIEEESKIVLISGDGDYIKVVRYLIKNNRFLKVLFPNRKFASSLYKKLGNQYQVALDTIDIQKKIEFK